jgi:hypothetical protein
MDMQIVPAAPLTQSPITLPAVARAPRPPTDEPAPPLQPHITTAPLHRPLGSGEPLQQQRNIIANPMRYRERHQQHQAAVRAMRGDPRLQLDAALLTDLGGADRAAPDVPTAHQVTVRRRLVLRVRVEIHDRTTGDTGAQAAAQPGVIGENTAGNRLEGIAPVAGNRRVGNFTRIFPKQPPSLAHEHAPYTRPAARQAAESRTMAGR